MLHTVFPPVSAGPQISVVPFGIHIEISAPPSNERETFKCGTY